MALATYRDRMMMMFLDFGDRRVQVQLLGRDFMVFWEEGLIEALFTKFTRA